MTEIEFDRIGEDIEVVARDPDGHVTKVLVRCELEQEVRLNFK
jgi:hypothetical protein